jgi:hypothetical protein
MWMWEMFKGKNSLHSFPNIFLLLLPGWLFYMMTQNMCVCERVEIWDKKGTAADRLYYGQKKLTRRNFGDNLWDSLLHNTHITSQPEPYVRLAAQVLCWMLGTRMSYWAHHALHVIFPIDSLLRDVPSKFHHLFAAVSCHYTK